MNTILKAIAGVLIAVIMCQLLSKRGSNFALLISITVCCMLAIIAMTFLQPVISFIWELQSVGNLSSEMMRTILKVVGIGLICEMTSLICADMGNASLGKSLQVLLLAATLWLTLPLFQQLLDLLTTVLGAL